MMADWGTFGKALQGLSAGLSGDTENFQRRLMLERAQQEEERIRREEAMQRAVFSDAANAARMAASGDFEGVARFAAGRIQSGAYPEYAMGDMQDVAQLAALAARGDEKAKGFLMNSLQTAIRGGQDAGFLPKEERRIEGGQVITVDPITGKATAQAVAGYTPDQGENIDRMLRARELDIREQQFRQGLEAQERDRALRERGLGLQEAEEARQARKLSAGLEKVLFTSQETAAQRQQDAAEFSRLADDFARSAPSGGAQRSVVEFIKQWTGNQDEQTTELLRRFNKLRVSEVMSMRQPGTGPMTDKDMEVFMSTTPGTVASPEQAISWAKGAAKAARLDAAYNQFKADFIDAKRDGAGINQAWMKKFDSRELGRKVTLAEIYKEAAEVGASPREIAEQIGVDLEF